ncbi:MAG TPA: MBL fold metallo-hydrolase, partial [Longimicrobiales bacterium]|nr:MBL fold metallo-hydrolase [Longimicrobiales bacterium]
TTDCAGFLVEFDGKRFYHSGDTALIMDFQLLKGAVDVALLPIGDNFTMGPDDAARAVEMIEPKVVIPIHYNTWPLIAQDPEEFRRKVGGTAEVRIVEPGGTYEF